MNAPRNTSNAAPEEHLFGMIAEGQSDYISGMERQGQAELVNSTVLPSDCRGEEEAILALGVTFGPKTDDLFREAALPYGWKRRESDHDMWSYIVDENGVDRIAVFYKAAFYDRKAFMHLA